MIITNEEYERYPFIKPRDGWYGATEIPQGWHDIIMIMCEQIREFLIQHNIPLDKYHCDQGKEKWGELCWYDSFDDDINYKGIILEIIESEIICHYREILKYTCTSCGLPGKMRKKSWIEPLCDNCFKLNNNEKDKEILS